MKMHGKIALITGAALGFKAGGPSIGSAIAFKLAEEGASVILVDILEEMGEKAAETIRKRGGKARFVKADVRHSREVRQAVEIAKEEFGGLHCLVNCAASYEGEIARNVVDISEKDWQGTIDVNLNGYFRFAKYAIPRILESEGGTIVNVSSCNAFKALENFSVYSVTKAGINALTRSLAVDFAPRIRVNTICPGFVKIANSEGDRSPEDLERWYAEIARSYPLKRLCSVEEIAKAALFLASDDSSYITGQTLVVDGGRMIKDSHDF